jgi:general secretion pathway protein H
MIVLAVMGLLAGVAVWRWPSSGDDAKAEAQALATRIAAARDQAIITGRPLALVVEPGGYRFEQRAGGEWVPTTETALRERRWQEGVTASIGAGGTRLRFDSVGLPDRGATLRLRSGGQASEVRILADGQVLIP